MASKVEVLKFLASAFNMVKKGDIKSLEDLFSFARQQFGQVDAKLSKQIKDTFDKGKVAAVTEKRTKDISMGDPTGEKREGLVSLTNELKQNLKDLKDLDLEQSSLNDQLMDLMQGFKEDRFGRKIVDKKIDKSKPFRTPGMPYQKLREAKYRLPGGSSYAEGNLRTAMREFLKTEHKAGNLKLSEEDLFRITEYSPMSADDPIDVFRRYYGEDALEAADAMASKLEKGTSFKNYEEIFRSNMPELKIKTQGAGSYDQSIIDAERFLQETKDQEDYAKTLDEFDVTDRKKNAEGGIMSTRAKFASGKIKLLKFLADKSMNLSTEIRRAVNNIFESGDKKLDADMAVDDMFENIGVDRDAVDQKDVLKAYDEAYSLLGAPPRLRVKPSDIADAKLINDMYKTAAPRSLDEDKMYLAEFIAEDAGKVLDDLSASEQKIFIDRAEKALIKNVEKYEDLPPPGSRGGPDDIAEPFQSAEKTTGNLIASQSKAMELAEEIQPGLFENLTDTQMMILNKYGGRIDKNLLKNIVLDPDPNNQAAAVATLDQAQALLSKGMSMDEVMSILQSTPRTKQAEGGIAGILKL
jgi:hypothetical protein